MTRRKIAALLLVIALMSAPSGVLAQGESLSFEEVPAGFRPGKTVKISFHSPRAGETRLLAEDVDGRLVGTAFNDIQSRGIKAGIALNPGTSLSTIEEVLPLLDFVLIMSVNPGFGGQKFIPYTLDKINRLSKKIKDLHKDIKIEVDGGVTDSNALLLKEAGADILVAGSSVFGKEVRASAISSLKV